MLDKRIYSRQELIDIYKTDRLDAIKKKITREGYIYKDCGRGKSYTMEILSLPDNSKQFKEYCIKEMGFAPQTNFIILKYFLYNVITNDDFITLQYNEMAEILKEQMKDILEKEKISVTAQTISKYFKQLQENDWIWLDGVFEFTYYVYDTSINHNRYIDKKEYDKAKKMADSLLPLIENKKDEQSVLLVGETKQIVEIYCNKNTALIEDLEETLETIDNQDVKSILAYRIARLYYVKKDFDNVKKYIELAIKYSNNAKTISDLNKILKDYTLLD